MFPVELGFPRQGFHVFRQQAKRPSPKLECFPFANRPQGEIVGDGVAIPGAAMHLDEGVRLVGSDGSWLAVMREQGEPSVPELRLEFSRPGAAVEVAYRQPDSGAEIVLRAFGEGGELLASTTSGGSTSGGGDVQRLSLRTGQIALATIPLAFRQLHAVCILTEDRICAEDWGRPVATLELERPSTPQDVRAMLQRRLGADVRNHYVAGLDEAVARYGTQLPLMLRWVEALATRDSALLANVGDAPAPTADRLTARASRSDGPLTAVFPQTMLLTAALDPNVARLLSLGWVDRFGPGQQAAHEDEAYDYKVTARWDDVELCGLALGVGAHFSPLPAMDGDVTADVLPGTTWHGTDPRRRVGLRWPRPHAQSAAQPVLFEVAKGPSITIGHPVREATRPVLVPARSWERDDVSLFVDSDASRGTHQYLVRGIDLFGQVSNPIHGAVQVDDQEGPPPPVRVSAELVQPGYPWLTSGDRVHANEPGAVTIAFEYGAHQLRQAPDAASVSLFWRPGSLTEERRARVRVRSREPLVVDVGGLPDASRFVGGILAIIENDGVRLPARERRRATIDWSDGPHRLGLAPSALDLVEGRWYDCLLTTDPRLSGGWSPIDSAETALRPPITGTLAADADAGRTLVVHVLGLAQPAAPAPLPTFAPAEVAAPIDAVEVAIDRPLLEPDLFAETTAEHAGASLGVLASTTGDPAHLHVGAADAQSLANGDELELAVGSAPAGRTVRYVELTTAADPALFPAGGELAFDVAEGAGSRLVTARIVSGARRSGNRIGFLVRFPPSLPRASWPKAGDRAQWFPPYEIDGLSLTSAGGAAGALRVQIAPDAGAASAYFVLAAEDVRDNVGPLSEPAQVTLVRTPPATAPSAPFPCGHPDAVGAFAGLPDHQGRATVCVAWTYAPSPGASIRFELGRALDESIVAVDRRNWLTGRARPGLTPVPIHVTTVESRPHGRARLRADLAADAARPDGSFRDGLLRQAGSTWPVLGGLTRAGGSVSFEVDVAGSSPPAAGDADLAAVPVVVADPVTLRVDTPSYDANRGLYRATLTDAGGNPPAAGTATLIEGGCLAQDDTRFQVTRATADSGLTVLLRPAGDGVPVKGSCTVEPPPDYGRVVGNTGKLRLLADKSENADAFGLVTGVPVEATRFRDEIPGTGRGAFFYRVRAVDPAENRSDWSRTSPPFRQVDTTPAPSPDAFRVTPGDRAARLSWLRVDDDTVTTYSVQRRSAADDAFVTVADLALADLAPAPLVPVAGSIAMPRPVTVVVPVGVGDVGAHLAGQVVVTEVGAASAANLFDVATSSVVHGVRSRPDGSSEARVTALAGLLPSAPDVGVRVTLDAVEIQPDLAVRVWTDEGLEGGRRYEYRVAAVRAVRGLEIPGQFSEPRAIVAIDRSVPPPAEVVAAAWVDSSARLTVRAPAGTARYLVERRLAGDDAWLSPPLEGRRGWQPWDASASEVQLSDDSATPGSTWIYRALAATADGRTAPPSAERELTG